MSEINGDRVRNMWISEGGEGRVADPTEMGRQLGRAALDASDEPTPETTAMDAIPQNPLVNSQRSMDEMVPRSWDWWK
ncbi:MAG TPA: hypothetical protein PKB09_03485 [Candidatus Saccharibacteria bacterium]|nr:hypothetical protein [Candidatus Saccharibacteria bacterium]